MRRALIVLAVMVGRASAEVGQVDDLPDTNLPSESEQPRNETRASLSITEQAGLVSGAVLPLPTLQNLLIAEPAFAWRRGGRWRAKASLAAIAATQGDTHARLRVKEAWGGLTLGDVDLALGKRILRWGTGYAFTPTGVLDPPRNPSDPTDRLSLNEGRQMAMAGWVRGRHALTAAWAFDGRRATTAMRYNTLVAGFDSALVFARDRGRPAFYGMNFTRVIGESLEVHGELAHGPVAQVDDLRKAGQRPTALLLGGKYTLRSGVSAIAEWYAPGAGRPRYFFLNLGKSRLRELPGWKHWDLSASLLANLTDGSRIAIFDVTRRLGDKFSATARAELPRGKRWQSEYGMIPYAALLNFGFRCQI